MGIFMVKRKCAYFTAFGRQRAPRDWRRMAPVRRFAYNGGLFHS